MFGTIADIVGISGVVFSFLTFILSRSLFKNMQYQKAEHESERTNIQSSLKALRDNVLEDNLDSLQIRSDMRVALYSYLHKYWNISSVRCICNLFKCIRYVKKPIKQRNKEKLCDKLDYLIAYLNRKEFTNYEHTNT